MPSLKTSAASGATSVDGAPKSSSWKRSDGEGIGRAVAHASSNIELNGRSASLMREA